MAQSQHNGAETPTPLSSPPSWALGSIILTQSRACDLPAHRRCQGLLPLESLQTEQARKATGRSLKAGEKPLLFPPQLLAKIQEREAALRPAADLSHGLCCTMAQSQGLGHSASAAGQTSSCHAQPRMELPNLLSHQRSRAGGCTHWLPAAEQLQLFSSLPVPHFI